MSRFYLYRSRAEENKLTRYRKIYRGANIKMGGPLEGVRVISTAIWQQGTVASLMLADMGAEVIKIENPHTGGDPGRGVLGAVGQMISQPTTGMNYYFEAFNRNKKSVVLDLSTEKGKEIMYKLIRVSDVFVSNMLPQVLQKLRIDYRTLSQHNPKIIYSAISGYGPKGPKKNELSYDMTAQAISGVMSVIGNDPESPPAYAGMGVGAADQLGGIMGALGIVLALFARETKGIGQEVATSLLGSLPLQQSLYVYSYLFSGQNPKRVRGQNPLWNLYQTKDGRTIVLTMVQTDRHWHGACRALGIEELEGDPRFNSHEKRAIENGAELTAIFDRIFITRNADEWLARLGKEGQICTLVNTFADMVNDVQVLENEYITEFVHPTWGKQRLVGIPIKFSKTPGEIRSMAPELGQHTEEVLLEILGYTWEEILELKEEGIIC